MESGGWKALSLVGTPGLVSLEKKLDKMSFKCSQACHRDAELDS